MGADAEIEGNGARIMVMQAAWKHERGDDIRHESSICKVFVAEAVNRIIDKYIHRSTSRASGSASRFVNSRFRGPARLRSSAVPLSTAVATR